MAWKIMIQGTMSNAGKSLLCAGLCRIFKQDGYKVAPFKSQNMALNSYITKEGLEIGRAQAMQAEACGIDPVADMNPILLKPTSNVGSQVIVNGEVRGNMKAMDYYKNKKQLIPDVLAAYERLSNEYDIIVIEGAGSPAEINLHENDIVNMGMARMAKAPVLLVGDIDRGGVFAALYGTVKLLPEDDQAMIKGLVVNKFRGDVKILEPGLRMIEEKTDIPVVGVVPMERLDIDDEDSLSDRLEQTHKGAGLDVAVIRLPHISNFTDFFTDSNTIGTLLYSMFTALVTTVVCLLIAYPVALILANSKLKRKSVLLMLFIMPMWISFTLRITALKEILTAIEGNLACHPFLNTIIGMTYDFLPFMILPLYTTLEKIDKKLLEASNDLGANNRITFLKVTLPLSMPGIISGVTMVFLPVMTNYVVLDMLYNSTYIMGSLIGSYFNAYDWHNGSMISIVLLVIIFIVTIFTNRLGDGVGESRGASL